MADIKHLHVLSAESMLSNSHIWLHQPDIVQALDSDPLGRGALAKVHDAHDDLVHALTWKEEASTSVVDLTRRITEHGREYDRLVRAIHGCLTALADGADHPDEATRYLTVRDTLLPIGLAITKQSYVQEHGAVLWVASNITPTLEAFLREQMVGTRSLWALYERWLAAGNALGALVKQRARLQAARKRGTEGAPMHVHEARQGWMRVVRVFVGALALAPLTDDVRRLILAPLRSDIAAALDARQQRLERAAGAQDTDVDAVADTNADAAVAVEERPADAPAVAVRGSPE